MQHRTRHVVIGALALMILSLPAAASELMLGFHNLAPLDEATDGIYEGWAIIDGLPVSTGVFNVNEMGQTVMPGTGDLITSFSVAAAIGLGSDIKITLEPVGDSDPAPSGLVFLTGAIEANTIPLHAAVPGLTELASAAGSYILATPSDNAVDDMNNDQGIWFLTLPGPLAGLTGLPDLGSHWTYEGWVVDVSGMTPMPYSTGTFAGGDGFDSDQAGCNGGGPPFPGQDFTAFHCGPVLDLDEGCFAAVITIEPVPDNSPAPFAFKPLAGMIPTDAQQNGGQLGNQTEATFPTGTAVIDDPLPTEASSWSDLKAAYR